MTSTSTSYAAIERHQYLKLESARIVPQSAPEATIAVRRLTHQWHEQRPGPWFTPAGA